MWHCIIFLLYKFQSPTGKDKNDGRRKDSQHTHVQRNSLWAETEMCDSAVG